MFKFDKEYIAWICNDLQKIWQMFSDIVKKKKKKNSDIKTSKMPNNIKESKDLLSRNYWNKTKYICDCTIEKHKRKMCYLQKNDLWLQWLKSAKLF